MSGSSTPILPVPRRLSVLSLCITEKSVVKDPAETEGITSPSAAADRGAGGGVQPAKPPPASTAPASTVRASRCSQPGQPAWPQPA